MIDGIFQPQPEPEIEAAAARLIAYPEHPTGRELIAWWMYLMRYSRAPFRDVMALFWHDHFATSIAVLGAGSTHFMRTQIETLRRLGRSDAVLEIMRENPDLTEDAARDKYVAHIVENARFWSLMRALNLSPDASPQDPGGTAAANGRQGGRPAKEDSDEPPPAGGNGQAAY